MESVSYKNILIINEVFQSFLQVIMSTTSPFSFYVLSGQFWSFIVNTINPLTVKIISRFILIDDENHNGQWWYCDRGSGDGRRLAARTENYVFKKLYLCRTTFLKCCVWCSCLFQKLFVLNTFLITAATIFD